MSVPFSEISSGMAAASAVFATADSFDTEGLIKVNSRNGVLITTILIMIAGELHNAIPELVIASIMPGFEQILRSLAAAEKEDSLLVWVRSKWLRYSPIYSVKKVASLTWSSLRFMPRERAVTPVWAKVRISSLVGKVWIFSSRRDLAFRHPRRRRSGRNIQRSAGLRVSR